MEQVKLSAKDLLEIWLKEREIRISLNIPCRPMNVMWLIFWNSAQYNNLHSMMWKPQIYVNFWLKSRAARIKFE